MDLCVFEVFRKLTGVEKQRLAQNNTHRRFISAGNNSIA